MTQTQHHDIVVIGAGIAGASIANEILARGHAVCVVEGAATPATGCSSHAYAIAHPHIARGSPKLLQLTRIGFALALARWGKQWNHKGILQPAKKGHTFDVGVMGDHLEALGLDPKMAKAVNAATAKKYSGIARAGVWFPDGGMLNLAESCKALLNQHSKLNCMYGSSVAAIKEDGDHWILVDEDGRDWVRAKQVIVAAGLNTKPLLASVQIKLPLKPVRGQLSFFKINTTSTWAAHLPSAIICGDGYCLPAERSEKDAIRWMVGSSFDENDDDVEPRTTSDCFNQEQAAGLLDFDEGDRSELIPDGQFVGVRCVAGDRLPIIGALPQRPGIFVATAFGSRGILWSALAAKLIADQALAGDFALLTRLGFTADLAAALAPDRFLAGALPPSLGALASNSKPIFPSGPKAK